jgi:fido (protein-threonine AMPylation protein)
MRGLPFPPLKPEAILIPYEAHEQYIESPAADIFRALRDESLLRGLPRGVFTERLTLYLGEVNAVHPFREGNGRAQRAFFDQPASEAGFTLNWQHLGPPAYSAGGPLTGLIHRRHCAWGE